MIQTDLWQEAALQELANLLQADASVHALILTGSCAQSPGKVDVWSDVDLLMVVADSEVERYCATIDWLVSLGPLFATDHSANEFWFTRRVCFADMRRVDFVITTETALEHIREWPRNVLSTGLRVLFSRSRKVNAALGKATPLQAPVFSREQFQLLINQFWFKSILAVNKTMRNDLLIGTHLALDLVRDCCVLAMALRDRVTGTNHHRFGGLYNEVLHELEPEFNVDTVDGILNVIEQSSKLFDRLATEWSSDYQERCQFLLEWITHARKTTMFGS